MPSPPPSMVREVCGQSTWRRKRCPSSTIKGFSITTPMGAVALLGGRVDNPLSIGGDKIGISQAFIEILGFRSMIGRRFVGVMLLGHVNCC